MREYRRKARQLEAAVVITVAVAVLAVFASGASAHRGSRAAASFKVTDTHMDHQCGNGWASYCYDGTMVAYVDRAADVHLWLLTGYWQERRFGGHRGVYACNARFVASKYHGIGWFPYSESCHRV